MPQRLARRGSTCDAAMASRVAAMAADPSAMPPAGVGPADEPQETPRYAVQATESHGLGVVTTTALAPMAVIAEDDPIAVFLEPSQWALRSSAVDADRRNRIDQLWAGEPSQALTELVQTHAPLIRRFAAATDLHQGVTAPPGTAAAPLPGGTGTGTGTGTGLHDRALMARVHQCARVLQLNGQALTTLLGPPHAAGLYALGSRINHACRPSACCVFDGPRLRILAARSLVAGEAVTYPYADPALPAPQRTAYLLEHYQFFCECEACLAASSQSETESADTWRCHVDACQRVWRRPLHVLAAMPTRMADARPAGPAAVCCEAGHAQPPEWIHVVADFARQRMADARSDGDAGADAGTDAESPSDHDIVASLQAARHCIGTAASSRNVLGIVLARRWLRTLPRRITHRTALADERPLAEAAARWLALLLGDFHPLARLASLVEALATAQPPAPAGRAPDFEDILAVLRELHGEPWSAWLSAIL
ncbi:hypothetical protein CAUPRSCDRAFT_11198 [Caulochytrium protostelioides]|uniref:SET domain-containing protein n=1 Tax=Caulochytrium protostelioides TaxID=1555241 RepID=A0A4P9WWM9_9FUNG|nr:hypothetical protein CAUPRSCDRAFT_11198 [Caulochytrium protostelioides]